MEVQYLRQLVRVLFFMKSEPPRPFIFGCMYVGIQTVFRCCLTALHGSTHSGSTFVGMSCCGLYF